MGCDIHLYVEKKIGKDWEIQGELVRDTDGWLNYKGPSFYDGRSYNTFAILANVRNGRGFAGCKTGEGFVPISEPRGVPDDASEEFKSFVALWGMDGHSHSYHTLRQLLDYDWTQTTRLQGWCNMLEWERWSRWGRAQGEGPDSYCGGVSGWNVKHITAAEADALFKDLPYNEREAVAEAHPHTYALAEWEEPYFRAASHFLSTTIPKLLALAGGTEHLDDVRIVFFFDN